MLLCPQPTIIEDSKNQPLYSCLSSWNERFLNFSLKKKKKHLNIHLIYQMDGKIIGGIN